MFGDANEAASYSFAHVSQNRNSPERAFWSSQVWKKPCDDSRIAAKISNSTVAWKKGVEECLPLCEVSRLFCAPVAHLWTSSAQWRSWKLESGSAMTCGAVKSLWTVTWHIWGGLNPPRRRRCGLQRVCSAPAHRYPWRLWANWYQRGFWMSELHDYGFLPPQSWRVKLGGSHPDEKKNSVCVGFKERISVTWPTRWVRCFLASARKNLSAE